MGTIASSENHYEMAHYVAVYQGLHYLLMQERNALCNTLIIL